MHFHELCVHVFWNFGYRKKHLSLPFSMNFMKSLHVLVPNPSLPPCLLRVQLRFCTALRPFLDAAIGGSSSALDPSVACCLPRRIGHVNAHHQCFALTYWLPKLLREAPAVLPLTGCHSAGTRIILNDNDFSFYTLLKFRTGYVVNKPRLHRIRKVLVIQRDPSVL